AVVPPGVDTGAMSPAFHNANSPTLNATIAAIVTAAASHRREGRAPTGEITRGQIGRTALSSSARAPATTASTENSAAVPSWHRSRAITDTPRNSSTWTGEVLSQPARADASRALSGPSSFATNHS